MFGGTIGKVTLLSSTGIKRLPGLFESWWVRCRATRYLPQGTQAGQSGTQVPQSGQPHGDLDRPRQAAALVGSAGCTGKERSEEHTSELQSLMRISYAVFCLKKKKTNIKQAQQHR